MNAIALSVGKLTHIGQVRSRNEDAMDLHVIGDPPETPPASAGDGAVESPSLFIVADGMGGHSAGNVASQMAVENTLARFYDQKDGETADRLRRAIEEANRKIYEAAQANADYFRMGTTIVSAAVLGNRADIANVGDSRVYIVRNGQIQQVTRDHSWVALQVEMGELTPEEAAVSQNRSVLLRCLGEKSDVLVDIVQLRLRPADILVLCTDGLHGLVNAEEIKGAVTSTDPQKACDDLVALANARGGPDNITVQVVRIDRCPEPEPGESEEIVIQRLSHNDSIAPDPDPPAPSPPPTPPAAPMYVSPSGYAPAGNHQPARPPQDASTAVPWMLIVLAFLAGMIVMAVIDRLYMRPVGEPTPESSGSVGSPLPSTLPSVLSSGLPLPSSPSGTASGVMSSGAPGSPAAGEEGTPIFKSAQRIQSPVVYKNALYWIEDGTLYHTALTGSDKPDKVHAKPHMRCVAGNSNALFVGLDEEVARLDMAMNAARSVRVAKATGPVQLVAAGDDAIYWVEESSHKLFSLPLGDRMAGTPQSVKKGTEDVTSLVVPPGSNTVYWAEEGTGIRTAGLAKPLVTAAVASLAANATHLYWTEDSKDHDGTVQLRRAGLDGSKPEAIATLRGPVSGLAASEHRVFWVVSRPDGFYLRSIAGE